MANKRNLKKSIRQMCGDIATDALLAAVIFRKDVDRNKINEIINDVACLQEESLAKMSFSFDKTPRDFETVAEYRKARRKYFSAAYRKLYMDFITRAEKIVKELNSVVPEEARRTVSSL